MENIEPLYIAKSSEQTPSFELEDLIQKREALTEEIHAQVERILDREYAGKSNETKESILKIYEKIITPLMNE